MPYARQPHARTTSCTQLARDMRQYEVQSATLINIPPKPDLGLRGWPLEERGGWDLSRGSVSMWSVAAFI